MVTACRSCNHRKANRTPLAAGMPLLSEPKVPNWLPPLERTLRPDSIPELWRPYLSATGDGLLDDGELSMMDDLLDRDDLTG